MTDVGPDQPPKDLVRENLYLRQRVADLQEDVASLGAERDRLNQILARLHGRAAPMPDPLAGGQ